MSGNMFLIGASIVSLFISVTVPGKPSHDSCVNDSSRKSVSAQNKTDALRGELDVCISYDEAGRAARISFQSNQIDTETGLRSNMRRENVMALIDELAPKEERGPTLRELKTYFGRAVGESHLFEKVQIDLTIVCPKKECEVSYALMKWGAVPKR